MSAIITNKLRIFNAQQFIESIKLNAPQWRSDTIYAEGSTVLYQKRLYVAIDVVTSNLPEPTHTNGVVGNWLYYTQSHYNNIYLGIGKSSQWWDDANPPTPNDSVSGSFDILTNLTSIKRVNPDSTTLSAPRIDWTSGVVYEMYDNTRNESIIPNGYVLVGTNNQYSVYKCLNNSKWNGTTGVTKVPSTVSPSGSSYEPFPTSDGYVWKYMYSIYMLDAIQFLTKDYMPVKFISTEPPTTDTADYEQWQIKLNAQSVENSGRIDWVRVLPDDGSNPDVLNTTQSSGDGYNNNIIVGNSVISVSIVSTLTSGFGVLPTSNIVDNTDYTGYGIYIRTTSVDSGSYRILHTTAANSGSHNVVSGGQFTFNVETPFTSSEVLNIQQIIIAPIVNVDGDGVNFSAYAEVGMIGDNEVEKIVILNKGTGYTYGDATVFLGAGNVTDTGGGFRECKVRSIISPIHGHGFNAVEELGAYYSMVSLKLEYDEQMTLTDDADVSKTISFFPVAGEESVFRQVSIISDPLDAFDGVVGQNEMYRGPNHPNYETTNEKSFDIKRGRGKVLYIENRQPVSRAIDQIEDIKVVFEF
jgi:hypothetical protein